MFSLTSNQQSLLVKLLGRGGEGVAVPSAIVVAYAITCKIEITEDNTARLALIAGSPVVELRHSDAASIEKCVGCNPSCITASRLVKSALCGESGSVHQTLLSLRVSGGGARSGISLTPQSQWIGRMLTKLLGNMSLEKSNGLSLATAELYGGVGYFASPLSWSAVLR